MIVILVIITRMPFNLSTSNLKKGAITTYPNIEESKKKTERKDSTKEKLNIESRRTALFSIIKDDCKGIPYWIPEPIKLKDYNIQETINRINSCHTLQQAKEESERIRLDHSREFANDYKYHRELHTSTLAASYEQHRKGERPAECIKPLCCFNHYLGLTTKRYSSQLLPVFDFELYLVHQLDVNKFVTYIASRGLGKTHTIISTFSQWKVWRSKEWDYQDVLLTTGLTQQNSTELLNKIEARYLTAFPSLQLDFAGTELMIDKTRFMAFPSENIKKMRLYDRVAAIFVDEADFFNLRDQMRLQEAVFGYTIKSQPLITFFSTLDKPSGFLAKARKAWIEKQRAIQP